MLTARDSWSDKVAGLDAGADDYLAKPFQTEELIARLRALIRRASGNTSSELTAGDVRLDTRSGRVTLDGEPVKLTAQEYKLLSYLMHHKGKVVSRTELIEHIYDQDFDRDSNTIEVFIGRLRKKMDSGKSKRFDKVFVVTMSRNPQGVNLQARQWDDAMIYNGSGMMQ